VAVPPSRRRRRLIALHRTRRLLRLVESFAAATTLPDLAQRIADATCELTGCDQAAVLLPDGAGTLRVEAAAPASAAARVFDREPVDEERLAGGDRLAGDPLVVRADGDANEALRDALGRLGIGAAVLLSVGSPPVRAVVSAEWLDPSAMPTRPLLHDDVRAVADHAAPALATVALLDAARHRALHDSLTGLPNQVLFADRAGHAVTRARRNGERLALGVLDLDRFKTVNDSLGHRAGDALLLEVAARLRTAVREHDTVARMGGDEFTLLLPDLLPHGETIVAERILAAFEEPFSVDGHAIRVSPSIGLAAFPHDGDTPERLLRNADAAMYRAKENGRNTWATYASAMTERAYDRLTLEADLHDALERRELRIAFEPVALAGDGAIAGAEALVRWSHPSFGLLEASEFLSIGEEIGVMPALDAWVLERACRELARADATGASPAWVTAHLSIQSLAQPALLDRIGDALTAAGLAPERLIVEVPEAAVTATALDVLAALGKVRESGVRVSIGQFGRANTPLATLAELPVDVLKLDRSFLRPVVGADDELPVLRSVVSLAHQLGLVVVADGADLEVQVLTAGRHGCDLVQGAAIGRAQAHVPAADTPADDAATPTAGG
jgi:diguanylate cyclase (GGDEF)-like protein